MKVASIENIRSNVIGSDQTLDGPFGSKPIVYADATASGKSLKFIEDYIQTTVLPYYANTHTEASATGLQTGHFREDARRMIREAVKAPAEDYAVLFCGSGSTAAINKMAHVLGISPLSRPDVNEPEDQRPVVFIGPFEHHSNELIWRESPNVDVVTIPLSDKTGSIDIEQLQTELCRYSDRPLRIGSFSAASNVTGIRSDTRNITKTLHDHGALAFFDFAAAGSHISMDIAGENLDAAYFSPHKYVGGPQTPGLLVARRTLFQNAVPTVPAGGTVDYVQPHGHKYLQDVEHREEGGTPAIVESIRAGLVFQLHNNVDKNGGNGTGNTGNNSTTGSLIEKTEARYLSQALKSWSNNPNIALLGGDKPDNRISIVSFLIRSPSRPGLFLHHNFVVTLLNDVFGIQSRGGCSCAGPYGHTLLDIDQEGSDAFVAEMQKYGDAIKPGWARVAFGYYFSQATVDYIVDAIHWVAKHGEKLLPWYKMDLQTTMWNHISASPTKVRALWKLQDTAPPARKTQAYPNAKQYRQLLRDANRLIVNLSSSSPPKSEDISLPESTHKLRWFVLGEDLTVKTVTAASPHNSHKRLGWRSLIKVFRKKSPLDLKDASDMTDDTQNDSTSSSDVLENPVPLEMPLLLKA